MSTAAPSDPSSPRRPPWVSVAVGAVIVVTIVALFLVLRSGDDSPSGAQSTGPSGPESVASTPGRLAALSKTLGRPIYWVGLSQGRTYELTQTTDGSVYVRYLQPGVAIGDTRPDYLTIGTYLPQSDPFKTVKQASERTGAQAEKLPRGGLAVANRSRPNSWYVAYPQTKELVEVFSPKAGRARELVRTGRVVPITG